MMPGGKDIVPKKDPKQIIERIRQGLRKCSSEAKAYGTCVASKLPEVEKGQCEKEFAALKACMQQAFKNKA
ncbi:hypothetical protein KFL_003780100 [Klebsormidium nitens]|uniref:Uncharacterized protein n=1 Tax=Klebsormidium nitens TaxID=105231 RepID=A0A1Y1IA09_KLENI|nr:hypothetical protein KFL_003780100 [Klebsormidium nitens]|eukprot:GAQ87804.1 hypothetical protein KFL_003780100 [Klebsormidium nitens]